MSFSNISDILSELNRANSNNIGGGGGGGVDGLDQKSGLALSNTSELEIKTMLRQIDTMINHKKLKWERQKQELDQKMKMKEQEFGITKAALDQKTHEIEQMKNILENMDTRTKDIMKKYENEIEMLNGQLNRLKSDYIRMQRKYKKSKENKRPSASGSGGAAVDGPSHAGSRLNSPSLNSSTSECLSEIQNTIVHQATPLRSVKRKSTNHIDIDVVTQLKTQLNEQKLKELEFINERDRLNNQMELLKGSNQELLRKLNEMAMQNANNFTYGEKLIYENELRKRDEYIKNLETTSKNVPEHGRTHDALELKVCKDELKRFKKQENLIRHELNKLKIDYNEAMKRLTNLEIENQKIKAAKGSINDEKSKATTEILNLKRKLTAEKERHIMEIEQLKSEIYSFSNQLADKNAHIRELNEQQARLEQELKEKDEQLEEKNKELIMNMAHCEALRLENNFLQQSANERKNEENNVSEMQKRFHELIELSERENKRLKQEVIQSAQLIEQLKSKPTKDTHDMSELNYRRIKLVKDDLERQMEQVKDQHEISLKRLHSEIEKLTNENYALIAELNTVRPQKTTISSSTTNSASSTRNLNVQRPNSSAISSLSNGTIATAVSDDLISQKSQARGSVDGSSSMRRHLNNADSPTQQIRLSLGSQFHLDDQKRKKELEKLLESHIEALKKTTNTRANKNDNLLDTDYS